MKETSYNKKGYIMKCGLSDVFTSLRIKHLKSTNVEIRCFNLLSIFRLKNLRGKTPDYCFIMHLISL